MSAHNSHLPNWHLNKAVDPAITDEQTSKDVAARQGTGTKRDAREARNDSRRDNSR